MEDVTRVALVLLAAALRLPAQNLLDDGWDHFYNLEYDPAIADFQRAIAQDPNSPDLHNHLAEAVVFKEMYRNGALESEMVSGNNSLLRRARMNAAPETRAQFLAEVGKCLNLCDARLKKNPNDSTALYALSLIHI